MSDTAVYPSAWFGIVFCLGQFRDVERGVRSLTSGFRPGNIIGSKNR